MRSVEKRREKVRVVVALLLALCLASMFKALCLDTADLRRSTYYVVKRVIVAHINGVITSATVNYIEQVTSHMSPGDVLVLVLDTPGGSLEAALEISRILENLNKPVIAFVYPKGSYAWSAGTLILIASHIAAMAPGTVIGSCQPVMINVITGSVSPVNESKIVNAVIGYFTEAAKLTGKNETFVRLCVLKNLNVGPELALRYHIISVVASSISELIKKINGTRDPVLNVTLLVEPKVPIVDMRPGLLYQVRQYLSNPVTLQAIFFIGLLILLVSGLTAATPLAIAGLALMLAALTLTLLPLNTAGVIMLVIGTALILGDLFSHFSSHGSVFAAGSILTAFGILLSMPEMKPPEMLIRTCGSVLTALGYSALAAAIVLSTVTVLLIYRTYRRRPYSETLLSMEGKRGVAVEDIEAGKMGYVKIGGEYWRAVALENINKGDEVVAVGMREGVLQVRKASSGE